MQVEAGRSPEPAWIGTDARAPWLEFRERLHAFVARRVSNPADVDDLVQRVFLQAHRNLDRIRSGERIHAWLYTTARRAIADFYRSRNRRREMLAGDAADIEAIGQHVAGRAEVGDVQRREVADCLAPVLETLAPADREAIGLTEIQGLRLAEAANRAGISLSGMKSRVQRARHRLRRAILDCCHVALDGRGAPIGCAKRDPIGGPCCDSPTS